jgi:hypothetical protein
VPRGKRSDITLKLQGVTPSGGTMDFAGLIEAIKGVHESCSAQAIRAVHVSLTLRNWAIGAYIHHYELHGQDRANYGEGLFAMLADRLQALNIPNCGKSRLYRYLDLFKLYPHIVATLSPLSGEVLLDRLSYSHIELLTKCEAGDIGSK